MLIENHNALTDKELSKSQVNILFHDKCVLPRKQVIRFIKVKRGDVDYGMNKNKNT